jgi:hypothetical protein
MRHRRAWGASLLMVFSVATACWAGAGGLTLGDPSPTKPSHQSSGGLTLGPSTPLKPPPSGNGGLSLTTQPPPRVVLPPDLPRLPTLPSMPPYQPPEIPPVPTVGQLCDCLRWDYAPDPLLTFFQISVSSQPSTYTEDNIRAIIPAIPDMLTEYPCAALWLSGPGPYYAVVQAVGSDPSMTSDYSDDVCLVVVNRKVYGCSGEEMMVGACRGSIARGP